MNSASSHRPRRLLAALALITLVIAGRFAESFHTASLGHAVCPEHGELMHVADVHEHADASDHDVPTGARIQPIETSAEHDHCLFATLLWSSGATWMPAETHDCSFACVSERVLVRIDCTRFTLPPLSFAPKHSPPARVV